MREGEGGEAVRRLRDLGIVVQSLLHVACHRRLRVHVPRDIERHLLRHGGEAEVLPREAHRELIQVQPRLQGDAGEVAHLLGADGHFGGQVVVQHRVGLQLPDGDGLQHPLRAHEIGDGREMADDVVRGLWGEVRVTVRHRSGLSTGADPGRDPTPKGGGAPPPFDRPQNGCTEQWVLWAPEILW